MRTTWKRGIGAAVLFLAGALGDGLAAAEDADASRAGDGTGSVMTLADLGAAPPDIEVSRPASPVPTPGVADFAVTPNDYYYSPYPYPSYHYRLRPPDNTLQVFPGPGLIVVPSPHDSWPKHGNSTGYWNKGYTITGDPTYMSYYERNFGWGLESSRYAGPRFDRSRGDRPRGRHHRR